MSTIDDSQNASSTRLPDSPDRFARLLVKQIQELGDARPIEVDLQLYELHAAGKPPFSFERPYRQFLSASDELEKTRVLQATGRSWRAQMGPDPGAAFRDAVAANVQKFKIEQAIQQTMSEDNGPYKPPFPNQYNF